VTAALPGASRLDPGWSCRRPGLVPVRQQRPPAPRQGAGHRRLPRRPRAPGHRHRRLVRPAAAAVFARCHAPAGLGQGGQPRTRTGLVGTSRSGRRRAPV